MKEEISKTGQDLIYLVSAAINGIRPDVDKVGEMNLEELYKYSRYHSLAAITYDAIEMLDELPDNPIMPKWKEERDKVIRKNLMFDSARKNLFKYLDNKHIWYMPLKGSILKNLYPKQEMRQMADNDILFDSRYQKDVRDYFVENGYEVISYNKCHHDVYEKKPVYNFEMHTSLFEARHNEAWCNYYADVKERLIEKNNSCQLSFTDEDFYVYFVAHAYKHFDYSGTGIRSFVDNYVYQKNKKLDWNYIEKEICKLGISDFEKTFRSTSYKTFNDLESFYSLNDEEYKMLCESMYSGTYGTMENGVQKKLIKLQKDKQKISKKTKIKYCIGRLIPPMSYYKRNYPFIYKWKIIIPFFLIYRFFRGIIINGKKNLKEMKIVWGKNQQ